MPVRRERSRQVPPSPVRPPLVQPPQSWVRGLAFAIASSVAITAARFCGSFSTCRASAACAGVRPGSVETAAGAAAAVPIGPHTAATSTITSRKRENLLSIAYLLSLDPM